MASRRRGYVEIPRIPATDGDKLRYVANWIDQFDALLNHKGSDEVQTDLRRIADRVDEIEHVADRLSIITSMSAYRGLADPPEFDFDAVLDQLELHIGTLTRPHRQGASIVSHVE